MGLHIVLVEPEIPQNTGNIARTCVAIDATLHLVGPLGFSIEEREVRRAGLDYWSELNLMTYDSFPEFLERVSHEALFPFTTKAKRSYTDISYPDETYLLFGKESKGLPDGFIADHFDTSIRIPMMGETRSLNLSNAVAIAAYEYHRQHDFSGFTRFGTGPRTIGASI